MFLVGDLNLNSLDYSKSAPATKFFNLCFQHTLFSLINRHTRVTKTSATAIDHIITNTSLQAEISSGIANTEINDHFLIFAIIKIAFIANNISIKVTRKQINKSSVTVLDIFSKEKIGFSEIK